LRYGARTMVGMKSAATSSNDSWGAGLQVRDLVAQPMFDKNVLAAGKSQTGEYFISTKGKTYELKWEMFFSKGD
jgi:hypothetical protein